MGFSQNLKTTINYYFDKIEKKNAKRALSGKELLVATERGLQDFLYFIEAQYMQFYNGKRLFDEEWELGENGFEIAQIRTDFDKIVKNRSNEIFSLETAK